MIRRTLVSCTACVLAVVCVLTPAVPRAQGQAQGRPIADLQRRVHMLDQQVADLSDGVLGSYHELGGLPSTTAVGPAGTVNLVGLPRTPEGRFVDLGLVVVDTQTTLVWEKKTTEVGSGENFDDLHDVDNTYTWCQATGNNAERCLGNATSWIGQVNAKAFAGFSNWRVPTRDELLTIADTSVAMCGFVTPCIDPIFGPTQASNYWSSTEVGPNVAWIAIFSSDNLRFGNKNDLVHVRAVRSGS